MLKNNGIRNLSQLLALYSEQNPEGFKENKDELLLLLSRMTIGEYLSLPNEQKLALYNNYSGKTSEESSLIWLWILVTVIAMVTITYIGLKYYKASRK